MLIRIPRPEDTDGKMNDEMIRDILDRRTPNQLGTDYIDWLLTKVEDPKLKEMLDDYWTSAYHAEEAACDIF